ncbi:aminopeptidase N-like [Saccoglossus kowalevskii]|uniref:glutamyl aminopeptidase n=1 Tax=Saccoglossus kowalevskii TaxID=10224 RepID=A0ABM0GQ01_SACKO|nr:PREDICTED: aminopeptidase N-like [Saccoglossus kowalevskii]
MSRGRAADYHPDYRRDYNHDYDNPVMASFSEFTEDIYPSRPPQKPAHAMVIQDDGASTRPPSTTPSLRSAGLHSTNVKFEEPRGFFISYCRLIWLVVVLVLLTVIVGLLAGLIRPNEEPVMVVSAEETQTTLDPSVVYHRPQLPRTLIPQRYDLNLRLDPESREFTGSVAITVKCEEATNYVVLHALELSIDPYTVTVRNKQTNNRVRMKTQFWFARHQYYVIEMDADMTLDEEYVISFSEFKGELRNDLMGLYQSDYIDASGESRSVVSSQFSPSFARKAYPCFDEPGFKAVFQASITFPDPYRALFCTPMQSAEDLPDSWKKEVYEETPPMATYLTTFVLVNDDYQYKERVKAGGYTIRFWARSAIIDDLDWALDVADRSFEFLEQYFGRADAMKKSDNVAVPTHLFSAMEGWGLATYLERLVVYNDVTSSTRKKYETATVVAHECSHVWFGNLVTMTWWNDLWLKEGFASFFMFEVIANIEPSWNMDEIVSVEVVQEALELDSFTTSHPLTYPDNQELTDLLANFDRLTYWKGASVLRMLENIVGADDFKRAIQNFLRRYEYSNADMDDIWEEVRKVTAETLGNEIDVKKVMDTWTLQKGYPVITATKNGAYSGQSTKLEQRYFVLKSPEERFDYQESPFRYKWNVLFTYVASTATLTTRSEWIDQSSRTVDVPDGSNYGNWIGNFDLAGFYRVNYEQTNWEWIIQQLRNDHNSFSPVTRAAIIDDAFSLQRAGLLDTMTALQVTLYLGRENHYAPWHAANRGFTYLRNRLHMTSYFGTFQRYILALLNDYDVTWFMPASDTVSERFLQEMLLKLSCANGAAGCVNEAVSRFDEYLESDRRIEPDQKSVVYSEGIAHGTVDDWDVMWSRAQNAQSPDEETIIMTSLTASRVPWVLDRYMQWSLNVSIVPQSLNWAVFQNIGTNIYGHFVAMDFIDDNWDAMLSTFGDNTALMGYALTGTSLINSDAGLQQLQSLKARTSDDLAAYSVLDDVIEKVAINVEWAKSYVDDVARFLESDDVQDMI